MWRRGNYMKEQFLNVKTILIKILKGASDVVIWNRH